ncbi:MAG TPA: hypothetical protein VFB81_16145 [Myxococcales bacterium]|nr:hypothetical protein [Myxococcales bacterium]
MKKKRPRRRSTKPPPAGAPSRPPRARAPALPRELRYKVVELSTVDEGSLERTFNEWTSRGWNLDGVQFAMRESSKRPAMAFVFFTREAEVAAEPERVPERAAAAREKLRALAGLPRDEGAGAADPGPAPAPVETSVRTAVELAAAALFDVTPSEAASAGAGPPGGEEAGGEENGALRWVELPEENDE